MIKGWRNNPEWVKCREDQKDALIKRQRQRIEFASKISQAIRSAEDDVKQFDKLLNRPRFSII